MDLLRFEPQRGSIPKPRVARRRRAHPGKRLGKAIPTPTGLCQGRATIDATPLGLRLLVSDFNQGRSPMATNPGLWDKTPSGFEYK